MNEKRNLVLNIIALICAGWFFSTSWLWVYLFCLVFSYPVGLIALVLWWFARKTVKYKILSRITLITLCIGLATSVGALFMFM